MTDITVESSTAQLDRLAKLAEAAGDYSAAVDAIMVIARLHGLIVERRIVEHVGMTEEAAIGVLAKGDNSVARQIETVVAGAALLRHAGRRLQLVE